MVEEAPAGLRVTGGGDDGAVVGFLVQKVAGGKDEFGAVLQELEGDFCVQDEKVVVHRVGEVATIQVEVRIEGKAPLLKVVADVQLRSVAEDVFRFLRCVAVGIAFPVEIVERRDGQMVYFIDKPQLLLHVRGLLAVVAETRLLVHHRQDAVGGIPILRERVLELQVPGQRAFIA